MASMADPRTHWFDLPDAIARELADPVARLTKLCSTGLATIVKANPQRTVYRVHLLGHDLHIKLCRVTGWRDRVRQRLRPAKAQLEYVNLLRAHQRNVPAIRAIGYGVPSVSGAGPSFLVTKTFENSAPLDQWLESKIGSLPPRRRQILASQLGQFIARIHQSGFLHPDLHPGNVLIHWSLDSPSFMLVDLHDTVERGPIPKRERLANLAIFNRWFILRSQRTDRLRFWRGYDSVRGDCTIEARTIESVTRRMNERLWRSRSARCLGTNRRFVRVDGNHFVRDWRPDEIVNQSEFFGIRDNQLVLKNSRRSIVTIGDMRIDGATRRVVIKRIQSRPGIALLANAFRADAALRSWRNGHGMIDCLLPTPRPLALVRRRRFGFIHESILITEFIPNACDLREAILDPHQAWKKHRRIELVARLIRRMHECGWSHRDLKAINILLAPDPQGSEKAWLIDLAGASRPWRLTRARRIKDIARLSASFHNLSSLSRSDRLRFLRIYLNWNLHGAGDWKRWWNEISGRTERKVERNSRRKRPLA